MCEIGAHDAQDTTPRPEREKCGNPPRWRLIIREMHVTYRPFDGHPEGASELSTAKPEIDIDTTYKFGWHDPANYVFEPK